MVGFIIKSFKFVSASYQSMQFCQDIILSMQWGNLSNMISKQASSSCTNTSLKHWQTVPLVCWHKNAGMELYAGVKLSLCFGAGTVTFWASWIRTQIPKSTRNFFRIVLDSWSMIPMIRETFRSPLRKLSRNLPNFFRQNFIFSAQHGEEYSRKAKKDAFIAVNFTPSTKLIFGMLNIFLCLAWKTKQ